MRIGIYPRTMASESVYGAANASRATVQDMGINHGRLDVVMAQKFLDRSDIVTTFEQVRGKGMPERMASGALRQSRFRDRISHSFLNQ